MSSSFNVTDTDNQTTNDLTAMLATRICHDLASPIGAIGNCIELLELTTSTQSEEHKLLSESSKACIAHIRLFRLAFGNSNSNRMITISEFNAILSELCTGSQHQIHSTISENLNAADAKFLLLSAMCLETATPTGAIITLTQTPEKLVINARGDTHMKVSAILSDLLGNVAEQKPATIHLQLLANHINNLKKSYNYNSTDTTQSITLK